MIRTEEEDISDELYEQVFAPFEKYMKTFFKNNILNEYVSFYIATAYKRDALVECNILKTFAEATGSLYQITENDCDKKTIIKILKEKYKLEIINENPINIKELD